MYERLRFVSRFVLYELIEVLSTRNVWAMAILLALQAVLSGDVWQSQPIQQTLLAACSILCSFSMRLFDCIVRDL